MLILFLLDIADAQLEYCKEHAIQDESEKCQEYSEAFAKIGIRLLDLPIENDLPKQMAQFLPNQFRAVDLGSNSGKFARQTLKFCSALEKRGTFWTVDPYPTNTNVLKMTSQQFMEDETKENLDLVLCKYSVHFNTNQEVFFQNVYKRMNDNGIFVIMQVGSNCEFPWTQPLQNKFKHGYIRAADIIPSSLFTYDLQSEHKDFQFSKETFIEFITSRCWSNLLYNTQEEIDDCVGKIKMMEEVPRIRIFLWKYTLRKKKA